MQLADGGVYDNQGVDTLLQESCSLILCSDASGQLSDDTSPSTLFLGVLQRANNITMERDRIVEYQDLRSRLENRALVGLLFVHLRQGLDIRRVPPECDKPNSPPSAITSPPRTDYGVDKGIQRLLSQIRTDLDSFSEVEADALMLSGYLATGKRIGECQKTMPPGERWGGFDTGAPISGDWPFQWTETYICTTPGPLGSPNSARIADAMNQLEASSKIVAKYFFMNVGFAAKAALVVASLAEVALLAYAIYWLAMNAARWLAPALVGFAVISIFVLAAHAKQPKWWPVLQRLGELAVAIAVWPIAAAGLWIFNRPYLRHGSRERLESIK
ncbi:MAG: hypothetical protein NT159_21010 [Proteobacteria bacterium]|nr:hypothetical protein [Pseudomonadota bacterium]